VKQAEIEDYIEENWLGGEVFLEILGLFE